MTYTNSGLANSPVDIPRQYERLQVLFVNSPELKKRLPPCSMLCSFQLDHSVLQQITDLHKLFPPLPFVSIALGHITHITYGKLVRLTKGVCPRLSMSTRTNACHADHRQRKRLGFFVIVIADELVQARGCGRERVIAAGKDGPSEEAQVVNFQL